MAPTPSTMVPLGTPAPDFTLPDTVSGRTMSLSELRSDKATVIMFICNHCPFVKHVQHELAQLAKDYRPRGVSFIAINSNDIEAYPEDAPDKMKAVAEAVGYTFPYLFDETQEVARAYRAACTPDIFIYDGDLKLAYRGQLDDSRPGNGIPVTGRDVRRALDALLAGQPVDPNQRPSLGCNIKWKS
ncbi:MAG: thioredoxin family protein [Caldilineales bacterium]|nr:thioredoxin family protein [Caldilineales bacterium]MDW8317164.1 thioredoxin family protein [Anaerolineae bacterium]